MRQVILNEPFKFAMQSVPEPAAGEGQALVRVRRIGVCGTDLHAYRGRQPYFSYPRVLGHEISGEIVAVGDNPDGLKAGDTCVVSPYLYCGKCIACRHGKTNCCTTLKLLGVHVDGAMQDLIAVPAFTLVRADGLTPEQMALVENQAIGAHAVRRAQLAADENVLVLGAGPIGFGVVQFAKLAGARVLLADLNEQRLEFAREWLKPDVSLTAGDGLDAKLRDETGGDYPLVVFDCTGSPASMMKAFSYVANGGRLVMVSLVQADITFNDPEFHRHELTVLSSRNATKGDFERVIAAMAAGQIVTTPFTQHQVRLDELVEAFPAWTQPDSGVLKAIVEVS
jgi:2-desacetyl-2-hydroxyethyl bacteriochlorophyllide A dehydrogenase